jgi:hypothetical protein
VCLNGYKWNPSSTSGTTPSLRVVYEPAMTRNVVFTYLKDHPRVSIPLILALLATLSFVVFDPLRLFFVSNLIQDRYTLHSLVESVSGAVESVVGPVKGNTWGWWPWGKGLFQRKDGSGDGAGIDQLKDELHKLLVFMKETPGNIFFQKFHLVYILFFFRSY